MKILNLAVVLFLFCPLTFAQGKEKSESGKNWEFGIKAGVADFAGERNTAKEARINSFNDLFVKNKFDRKLYLYTKIGLGANHLWKITVANPLNEEHLKRPAITPGSGVSSQLTENINFPL